MKKKVENSRLQDFNKRCVIFTSKIFIRNKLSKPASPASSNNSTPTLVISFPNALSRSLKPPTYSMCRSHGVTTPCTRRVQVYEARMHDTTGDATRRYIRRACGRVAARWRPNCASAMYDSLDRRPCLRRGKIYYWLFPNYGSAGPSPSEVAIST